MNYLPIIQSKLKLFKKNYGISTLDNNTAFEMFINNMILRTFQPEDFSVINDLFDQVCVGGQDDTGIDGLAIKVNNLFVATKADIDDIVKRSHRIQVEFIFVQSKYKEHLDSGEFGKFMDGILDFLSDSQYEPSNPKISNWLALKEYICSEDILVHWESNPNIKIYFAYTGTWNENQHITAKFDRLKENISHINLYNKTSIKFLDGTQIKKLCDDVENQFKKVITIIDSLELDEAPNVDSSRVLLCAANDFIKLLLDDDNNFRRTLFKDNVRDYQGSTEINEDIFDTLKTDPYNFCLLNNGITIVCHSMQLSNRKISIENPQIVNGCQTCNTLYRAYEQKIPLNNVALIIKLIATDDANVTNAIVKGTNRQNVVYDEAFEITRKFHKDFEEYVEVIQLEIPTEDKIYYERRSNQFNFNPTVNSSQKANFKVLIQSFVSIILQCPHEGFVHDSNLLTKYKNKIFVDGQSFKPYYLAISLNTKTDTIFKGNYQKFKKYTTYKHQILCLLVEMAAGRVPDINNNKKIDDYCDQIIAKIQNKETFLELIENAIQKFDEIYKKWIQDRGSKFRYAIKDNADFTQYMLTYIRGGNTDRLISESPNISLRGMVVAVKKDRHNLNYGYIKHSPQDVFIHEDDHPHIRFYDLVGKDVVYTIIPNTSSYGTPRGKISYVIGSHSNSTAILD